MEGIKTGLDAIKELNGEGESEDKVKFKSFKTGTTLKLRILNHTDISSAYTYDIFRKVTTFAAKNPSTKSNNGYPIANYTPWDLAWKYHKDKSKEFNDKDGMEASKYKPSKRFAFGAIDLETGNEVLVDLSKNQTMAVYPVIEKNKNKLDKKYIEITKTGQGKNAVVMASAEDLEDLTDEERKNFDNAPEKFDEKALESAYVRKDEDEQVELLKEVGFDVSLIGFDPNKTTKDSEEKEDKSEEFPETKLDTDDTDEDPTAGF